MVNANFWRNKKVLITGHTGFKGTWLCLLLQALGAEVQGLSLRVEPSSPLFTLAQLPKTLAHHELVDIRDARALSQAIDAAQPQVIFHLAAQSLVSAGYADPISTFHTNVDGTLYLLESVRQTLKNPIPVVVVTSDKCYLNLEHAQSFTETDPLGGYDPYSASKAMAEILTTAYRQSFLNAQGHLISSARAGNVIGAGDFSERRLLPDIFRAYYQSEPLILRYPQATRPWQHVLDALYGYLLLVEKTTLTPELSGAYNFGPPAEHALSVESLCQQINGYITQLNPRRPLHWIVDPEQKPHESQFLHIDTTKAQKQLHWQPQLNLEETLQWTVTGYLTEDADLPALVQQHIQDYLGKLHL